MRNFFGFFVKGGQTTSIGGLVVMALALAANVLIIGMGLNNILGWAVLIASWIAILVFGVAAKAEALGSKPFTNDPLGWRKAKESYKETIGAENGEQD